ncbi:MFS general substrate transporter [Linderina pennispora]|uniref:MFS general substrate transporter n=1 Tax=Linderina pennispora TaxID=61395 RepID=A0A1Y1W0K4_9FUNG|nr:MFS general substrate transporter [Linderina pennispora]ORX66825.1 MFS general substrate transporter [Linderina pennispora]
MPLTTACPQEEAPIASVDEKPNASIESDTAYEEDNPPMLQSWIVLMAGFIVHMFSFGIVSSYGVYQVEYLHPCSSWIGTMMFFGNAFFGLFASMACERFDARYISMGGILVIAMSLIAASFCITPWALLLTQGSAWLVSLGRPWAMRITGFIILGAGMPASWLLKPRTRIVRQGKLLDFSLLRDIRYVLLLIGSSLSMASVFTPYFYMSSYSVVVLGMSQDFSTKLQMLLNLTSLISRVVIDLVSHRVGALNTLVVSTFAGALGIINSTMLIIAATIYGISWGIMPTLHPVVAADLYGSERLNNTLGVIYFGYAVATLPCWIPLETKPTTSSMIIYCSVQLLCSALAMLALRLLISKKFLYKC